MANTQNTPDLKFPFVPTGNLTKTAAFNVLAAGLRSAVGDAAFSKDGQAVLFYFKNALTAGA